MKPPTPHSHCLYFVRLYSPRALGCHNDLRYVSKPVSSEDWSSMVQHFHGIDTHSCVSVQPSLSRACRNIKEYLIKAQVFNESEMLILCDDGRAHAPTRRNIEDAFRRITEYSQAGDVVFVHVRT